VGSKLAKIVVGASVAGVLVVFVSGLAGAVSGGGYSPDQQDCHYDSSAWNTPPDTTEPGCHNLAVNVESGGTTDGNADSGNTRYVELGADQLPNDDHNPGFGTLLNLGDPGTPDGNHSGCLAANTDGTGGGTGTGCGDNPDGAGFSAHYDINQVYCPVANVLVPVLPPDPTDGFAPYPYDSACADPGASSITPDTGTASALDRILHEGVLVYFGQDDNTDNGEHDGASGTNGTDGVINGPSDGGSTMLAVTPQGATTTPSGTHPEGLVNGAMGFCADGICFDATTQEQTVYEGCGASNPSNNADAVQCTQGTPSSGRVFENGAPSSTQEPDSCSSGGATSEQCGGSGLNQYRAGTPSHMNAEPGVQLYQDPDPQRSPIFWVPGAYVGTCGVYLDDKGGANNPGTTGVAPGYVTEGVC